MKIHELEQELRNGINDIYNAIKGLAPYNNTYVSNDNGKSVPYIYVNNKRVFRNTNNLYNNVMLKEENNVFTIYVDDSKVPYYTKAVLNPVIEYKRHFGRSEYGDTVYSNSQTRVKQNRNYLYYMKGSSNIRNFISKYNGRTIRIEK